MDLPRFETDLMADSSTSLKEGFRGAQERPCSARTDGQFGLSYWAAPPFGKLKAQSKVEGRDAAGATSLPFPLDLEAKILASVGTMAEKDEKWPENVKGKFYVDEQCIDCDLCRETAPDFFTRNEDGGYSFVHKQPEAAEDVELCMEALEGCPVEAIGDDGDE